MYSKYFYLLIIANVQLSVDLISFQLLILKSVLDVSVSKKL